MNFKNFLATKLSIYVGEKKYSLLSELPSKINDTFWCTGNPSLSTLEGFPTDILFDFNCYDNSLTSLKGAPSEVNGKFDCSDNNLTSLEYGPLKVSRFYNCSINDITSLPGSEVSVPLLDCSTNLITSLLTAPSKIEFLECKHNRISSLVGVEEALPTLQALYCEDNPIKEGGLGLLLLDDIRMLRSDILALDIIHRYLNKGADTIYDCQQELIEKGYEAYAQL